MKGMLEGKVRTVGERMDHGFDCLHHDGGTEGKYRADHTKSGSKGLSPSLIGKV
jgi:hypothetical protein